MFTEEIYKAAKGLCPEEPAGLYMFCRAAEKNLLHRLKRHITVFDCFETFIAAAALMAISMVKAAEDSLDDVSAYTVGNVSVTKKGTRQNTKSASDRLMEQAERMMAPYIAVDAFQFTGVRGR